MEPKPTFIKIFIGTETDLGLLNLFFHLKGLCWKLAHVRHLIGSPSPQIQWTNYPRRGGSALVIRSGPTQQQWCFRERIKTKLLRFATWLEIRAICLQVFVFSFFLFKASCQKSKRQFPLYSFVVAGLYVLVKGFCAGLYSEPTKN